MLPEIIKPPLAAYLILIELRKDLCEKILDLKKEFSQKFKTAETFHSLPHISLVKYKQYISFESRIEQRLQALSEQSAPFNISLQQFGTLPTHTIYINVAGAGIQHLTKNIRTQLNGLLKTDKENKPFFILGPNIPIAQKLKPWQYEASWPHYLHQHFSATFIATGITVLRKETDNSKYQILKKFTFQNIQPKATQPTLF